MGVTKTQRAPANETMGERSPIVNDFSVNVATANGTGSRTANLAILRSIFKMGIPVNGKNIFPSNIQGLPTWYQMRISSEGYVARRENQEILIAFNPASVNQDVQNLNPGEVCIYNTSMRGMPMRDDIIMYGIPVKKFITEAGVKRELREYLSNMCYVGALAYLLGIDLGAVDEALDHHFKGRRKLVETNMNIINIAYKWSQENLTKADPYQIKSMSKTDGKIVMNGNYAGALGCVFGGVSFVSWYPITPSTGVIDAMTNYLGKMRRDEDGKATCAIVQAEDELAAIGMVIGAGWAGARSMTATSGAGVSLMAEFAGLSYFAEVPAMIWNVQRVGPSTGLPTRTCQGDITFCYYLGHGDTKHVLLLPATIAECFEFGTTSLNLAEELQTLVFVMSDLDLGMNNWMSEPFDYPTEPITRGKVLSAQDVAEKGFARYRDLDGDGIAYRTLPGNEHPLSAYFTRGTGHDDRAKYSEDPNVWLANMDRLVRKFETARELVPTPVVDEVDDADFAILAFGSTKFAIDEARDRLAADGIKTSYMRLRALPINQTVKDYVAKYDKVYVLELNRDGQMHSILQTEMPEMATKLVSVAYLDGMPLTARKAIELLKDAGAMG